MQGGDLRHKVRFERRQDVDDGYGNVHGAWVALFDPVKARIIDRSGNEAVQAAALTGTRVVYIWVRSSSETRQVTERDRVVDHRKGTEFNINEIRNPDGRDRWLRITAEAGGAV